MSGFELRGEHTGNQTPKFSSYLLHWSGGKKLNSLFFKYLPPNNNHKLMDSAELKKKKTTATKGDNNSNTALWKGKQN